MAQMSDTQKPSHETDHETDNTQVFKIDHMVVIYGEPIHKVLFKLATWFAILWVCIILVIYFMEPDTLCMTSVNKTLDVSNKPYQHSDKMIIIYNDDGHQLE